MFVPYDTQKIIDQLERKTKMKIKTPKQRRAAIKKLQRPYFEDDKTHKIVDDAIKRMAAEERQAWSSTIEKPGLHVRKSPMFEGSPQYDVVRAVGLDKGQGMCIKVYVGVDDIGRELSDFELSQSQFQRIEE